MKNRRLDDKVVSDCGISRKKADRITLENDDLEVLRTENVIEFQTYRRAVYKGILFTTRDYDENKAKCNSLIEFLHQGRKHLGEIICVVKTSDKTLCLVETFKIVHEKMIFHRVSMQKVNHLRPVRKSNVKVLVEFSSILTKVFKVGDYIAVLPNEFERSL